MAKIKNYFFRGLAIVLPTILTIWIFIWGYNFIQNNISNHINKGLVLLMYKIPFVFPSWTKESLEAFWIEGWGSIAGFIIALVVVVLAGFIFASVIGRALWKLIEGFIMNTPLLRRVYPYVKQVTDFLLTPEEQKKFFSRVVAVEYPRRGIWSIGFVTGSGLKEVTENQKKEFLTILIPNSPMPVTGYVIVVPKEDTIPIDMTIEEAFRFAVSAGVIAPGKRFKEIQGK